MTEVAVDLINRVNVFNYADNVIVGSAPLCLFITSPLTQLALHSSGQSIQESFPRLNF